MGGGLDLSESVSVWLGGWSECSTRGSGYAGMVAGSVLGGSAIRWWEPDTRSLARIGVRYQ